MSEAPSVCVCGKCGVTLPLHVARLHGWLVRELPGVPAGRWFVRCPEHVTRRARLAVGLPEYGSIQRVGRFIDRGLYFEADGVTYTASRVDGRLALAMSGADGVFRGTRQFETLPALCLAMVEVADLRRWRLGNE